MENYTTHDDSNEEPNVEEVENLVADDDEFSDILSIVPPIEIDEDAEDDVLYDVYLSRLDEFADALDELRNRIDDDETAEIWRELAQRIEAGRNIDPDTASLSETLLFLRRIEEAFGYLVLDIIGQNQ